MSLSSAFFFGIRSKQEVRIDHPLISPEVPDEFNDLPVETITLIRQSRSEKVELRAIERERALVASCASEHVLDRIDKRMRSLGSNRDKLRGSISRLVPGYSVALRYAIEHIGFDSDVGTIRFYKRRGCFTFGMPGLPVIVLWIQKGEVNRVEQIDW